MLATMQSDQTLFAEALHHHQAGRLTEAEGLYRQLLAINPRHAEGLHLLGLAAYQTGRHSLAAEMIGGAIAINPDVAAYHSNLGNALRDLGRFDDAVASFHRAVDLRPDLAEAHTNLGAVLADLGRLEDAATCHRKAIALKPNLQSAHTYLGIALQQLGRLDEAVLCFRKAVDLTPTHPQAHFNLATSLEAKKQLDEAVQCYRRAIELDPGFQDAYYNLGSTLRELGLLDNAAACYRRALDFDPKLPQIHLNLGNVFWDQRRLDKAVACYRTALDLQPDSLQAHNNLGNALRHLGRLDEAITSYRAALTLDPDFADAHFNLAMTLLTRGDLAEGWREFEWRCKTAEGVKTHLFAAQPQWRGEPVSGQTLLINPEGGLGDTLQFCRYAPMAAARGLRVILGVQAPLFRLLQNLPGVDLVLQEGEPLPPFDLYCPMLSLPMAFGTTLSTIPSATPYLQADAAQAASWSARLASMAGKGPRVGMVWAGNPRPGSPVLAAIDSRRSLPPERLMPLFNIPGLQFFSLQKFGPKAPAGAPLTDFMDEMQDFADTAALIANLDLVISVDTGTAHLAAALGKPVWILERFDSCWHWLTGRRDSPWYPTVRLYRQPQPDDWTPVLAEIASDLRALVEQHEQGQQQAATAVQAAVPALQAIFADAFQCHQAGRLDEAKSLYQQILALDPRHADSLHLLGLIAYQSGDAASAIDHITQAIVSNPKVAFYHSNLGNALLQQGRASAAVAFYQRAIDLDPDVADAHYNLANTLKAIGQTDEAIQSYRRAIERKPGFAGAYNNLGILLWELDRLTEAEASCRSALEFQPDCVEAHLNLGNALRQQGRLEEAAICYRNALRLRPDLPEAHFHLAMVLLAQGDMAAGWLEYEWRFKTPDGIKIHQIVTHPWWRGEAAEGRTLLIQAEGGLGDTVQFCRYATLASARGLRVILGVQTPMVRLLKTLPGVDLVLGEGEQLPDFDLYCPMLSLPLAFGTTLTTVPAAVSYLHADPAQAASWQARLAGLSRQARRIGLVWAGNPRPESRTLAPVDRRRSLPPERLAPLFDVQGLQFFSLQKGGPEAPDRFPLTNFMDEMADFADTAALIANLDLVISVDTGTAHLAAALGKPVWLLERFDSCFRWLTGRRDSPWYPTVRLYRQARPGDWNSVLDEVTDDLRRFAAA